MDLQGHPTAFDDLIGRNSANSITFQGLSNQGDPLCAVGMQQTAGFATGSFNAHFQTKHRDKSFIKD